MDANAFKTNLKTVKELILDEHKLVTYISLSKELCIHVNEAKSLLCLVIKDIRKAQPGVDLNISYVISGLLDKNSGCTTVCPESDIDTLKKTLKIVFYEHVYCVSRGLESVDSVALTAINKFEDLPLCTGLIKANSRTKRTDDEIRNLKSKNHAISIVTKTTIVQQKNTKDKVKEVIKNEHEDTKKSNEEKLNTKAETSSPKKKVSINNKTHNRKNSNKTAAKGIAGFFSKVNGDSSKAIKAKIQEPEVKVEEDIKVELLVESTSTDTNISPSAGKKLKEKTSNNKSLTQIKKNAKVDKKRKRLLCVSDSESETEENDPFTNEMDVNHESEDEIPPTPTVNTVKITSGIINPKKRRKIVDKTYTDEDGYILTKKEEVYESCSENEEEAKENVKLEKENVKSEKENVKSEKENVKQRKENPEQVKQCKTETSPKENKSKKRKVSPPQKGKQSTINNFFKKV